MRHVRESDPRICAHLQRERTAGLGNNREKHSKSGDLKEEKHFSFKFFLSFICHHCRQIESASPANAAEDTDTVEKRLWQQTRQLLKMGTQWGENLAASWAPDALAELSALGWEAPKCWPDTPLTRSLRVDFRQNCYISADHFLKSHP